MTFKQKIYKFLKWLEKFTGTDMIYLTQGGFWLTLGKVIEVLIGLGVMILFGRLVTKEVFGAYQYILSLAGLLGIFSLGGIDMALARTVARGNERMFFPCFKTKLKWGSISTLIFLFIAGWYFFHQNYTLGICFIIVALFLPFINAFTTFLAFWQGKKRFDIQNRYYILYNLLSASLLILIILITKKLTLIILGYFVGFFLAGLIFYSLTVKKALAGELEKDTISFGKHLTLMNAITTVGAYLDKIILWQLLGPVTVAIYSFAERPIIKLRELLPISTLALPKLSQRNIKEIKKGLWQKFFKLFLAVSLVVLIYILLCPYFFKLLFPAYLDSVFYSQILSLSLIFFSPFALLTTSFAADLRKKELYILNFITPSVKIILFLILIPLFSVWGLISAVLVSQFLNAFLTLYFFKKI